MRKLTADSPLRMKILETQPQGGRRKGDSIVNRRDQHLVEAKKSIRDFSIDTSLYHKLPPSSCFRVRGTEEFVLWSKAPQLQAKIEVVVPKSTNCQVFIGEGVTGKFRIVFRGSNAIVWIGDRCQLCDVDIRSAQANDLIAIGNEVTTTGTNTWVSGNGAGTAHPAMILGDDCMLAAHVILRNSDAHPIINAQTGKQMNEPVGSLHLEPHVWLGDRVSVLKSVRIGACSIVGLGSIVTQSLPRFSVARGVPARAEVNRDQYWSRSPSLRDQKIAKQYRERFLAE